MRVLQVRRLGILLSLIIAVWIAVFASGIHATVAGILVALLVPIKPTAEPRRLLDLAEDRLRRLRGAEPTAESMVLDHEQLEAVVEVEEAVRRMQPAGLRLEHYWHPVQAFLILPLFALANAGVRLDQGVVQAVASPVGLGIILGLFLGKQVGFMLFSWLAIRSGKADLPDGVTWPQFWGMSCLAGIGFTMSLFVSELAFTVRIADCQRETRHSRGLAHLRGRRVYRAPFRVLPKSTIGARQQEASDGPCVLRAG